MKSQVRRIVVPVVATAVALAATNARAQPEKPGPYAVDTWTPTSADNPPVPLSPGGVFIPKAPGPFAPVALVHGGGENGGFHTVMAQTLASHGVVVLAPTFPDELFSPTQADGDKVNALLDWAAQKSGDMSSPLAGKVDGSGARGVLGHSNGGVVFYAAAKDPLIKAIVSLDGVAFLDQAPGFHGPSLHLLSQHADCGGGSSKGYGGAPAPKLLATVVDGDHCDVNDPADSLCPTACGGTAWNQTASGIFHRYAVAWIACILAHDPTVAPWIGGAAFQADVDAGLISGTQGLGLDQVTCDGGTTGDAQDAGSGDGEGGRGDSGSDSGATDSGSDGGGAAADSGDDGGSAEAPGATTKTSGCACRYAPDDRSTWGWLLAAGALALGARSRGRARRWRCARRGCAFIFGRPSERTSR